MQTNESQTSMWKGYKVIGIINSIYLTLHLISNVIILLVMALKYDDVFEEEKNIKTEKALFLFIYYSMDVLICIVLLFTNFGLISQKSPVYGSKVKEWLLHHTIIFCIALILSILGIIMFTKQPLKYVQSIILVIVLLIELIVVRHFYKKMTSASGSSQSATV